FQCPSGGSRSSNRPALSRSESDGGPDGATEAPFTTVCGGGAATSEPDGRKRRSSAAILRSSSHLPTPCFGRPTFRKARSSSNSTKVLNGRPGSGTDFPLNHGLVLPLPRITGGVCVFP